MGVSDTSPFYFLFMCSCFFFFALLPLYSVWHTRCRTIFSF